MTRRPVLAVGTLGALCATLFLAIFLRSDEAQRDVLTVEVGKALTQVLVVGALGAGIKFVVDRYQDSQALLRAQVQAGEAKDAQDQAFRQDIYQSVVRATNRLRRVPVLIEANRSTKTWSEQMLEAIDVGLDLRMIKHQIYLGRGLPDPPFTEHRKLVFLFRTMYRYTDWLAADFGDHKKELSELQRRAEDVSTAEGRAELQDEVWRRIRALPTVESTIDIERAERAGSAEDLAVVRARRRTIRGVLTAILADLDGAEESTGEPDGPEPSWLTYQEAEGLALELIIRETGLQSGTA